MPMTPTRLPVKSTGSCGQCAVCSISPAKLSSPANGGRHRRGQWAGGHQSEPGGDDLTGVGGDSPAQRRLVEDRRDHPGVEGDVAAQIEFVGHPVDVAQDLALGGVLLRPVPLLLELSGERIAVVDALHVAARTRVPIVIPGSADIGRRLEHPYRQPLGPQFVQGVQACEAGTDNHRVQILLDMLCGCNVHRDPR